MTRLSDNFTLAEMIATNTGAPNAPDERATEKLLYLASFILQPIRDRWGLIRVTSGYRSPAVNLKVGGQASSQHLFGEAADIIPLGARITDVYRWIAEESRIAFGQCIYESRGNDWIHISLPRTGRRNREALLSPEPGLFLKFNGRFA